MRYWPHQCVRGHPKPRHAVIHINFLYIYNRLFVTLITSILTYTLYYELHMYSDRNLFGIFHFFEMNYN